MKMISFSFFILAVWLTILTFLFCQLKDDYNKSAWVKDCKENGMKLFELKEIKEND